MGLSLITTAGGGEGEGAGPGKGVGARLGAGGSPCAPTGGGLDPEDEESNKAGSTKLIIDNTTDAPDLL